MTAIVIPNTFLPSTTISSTAMNANFTAVATAIDNSLDLAGTETMTAPLRAADGTALLPGYTFGADLNTGIYRKTTDQLGFATAGVLAFFIDAAAKGWFSAGLDVATALHVGTTLLVDGAATFSAGLSMSSAASRTTFAESLAQVGAGFGIITNLASAGTTDLGSVPSHYINVTGTTTITSFGSSASQSAPVYLVRFASALTITNSANIFLPNGVSLVVGANDHVLMRYGGAGVWQVAMVFRDTTGVPSIQRILSGAGTYVPAVGTKYTRFKMLAAGGGGGAATTNNGSAGSNTTLESWVATGGGGGLVAGNGGAGGTGGANGTGTLVHRQAGASGNNGGTSSSSSFAGGAAHAGIFGGSSILRNNSAQAAPANSGAGGSGAWPNNGGIGGAGGNGEYVEFIMTAAQMGAGVSYSVGALGAGGAAGGTAGSSGGSGLLIGEDCFV